MSRKSLFEEYDLLTIDVRFLGKENKTDFFNYNKVIHKQSNKPRGLHVIKNNTKKGIID